MDGFNLIYVLSSNPYLSIQKSKSGYSIMRQGYWYVYEDPFLTPLIKALSRVPLMDSFQIDNNQFYSVEKEEFCEFLEDLLWDYVLQRSIFYQDFVSK